MTPVRAVFASLFAALFLGGGVMVSAGAAGASPHHLAPLLSFGKAPFSLLCFLAAWGAIAFGAFGVLAAFLAFIAPGEEDDPPFRRRGFPKSAPVVLILISVFLFWLAFRCADERRAAPIAIPVAPDAEIAADPLSRPAGDDLVDDGDVDPVPRPVAAAASFSWPFKDPLVRDHGGVWGGAEPFADETENERLLCGKAWIAATGSASEEGPAERNARRARMRAERARRRAEEWSSMRPECGAAPILAVDLGQHSPTGDDGADGAATAYQRQVLVISRARAAGEANLGEDAARAELAKYLADPDARAALYAGRRFSQPPVILDR